MVTPIILPEFMLEDRRCPFHGLAFVLVNDGCRLEAEVLSRKILLGKIHRATVTAADVNYMGSITVDPLLIEASGLLPLEEVEVWDVTNGERFSTYCLPGKPGDGRVTVNGAAARRVTVGDKVIVAAYGMIDQESLGLHEARVAVPDDANHLVRSFTYCANLVTRAFEIREST